MAKKVQKKKSFKGQAFSVAGLLMAIVFLPTTLMLMIGTLPTFAALFVDRTKRKTKVVTVGVMNVAGCVPFILELWTKGHNFERAVEIISNPQAVVVMYSAAAVGYLIDWAMTGIVASFLLQRGKARSKAIKKRQEELVQRWGREITGEVNVDKYGFEVEGHDKK
ncbi:MAG: hypothetical protein AB8B83_09365 [Bdellovibrionales bacterium]